MSSTYTGNGANVAQTTTPTITIPADGDAMSAASVNAALQKLNDQVALLWAGVFAGPASATPGLQGTGGATAPGVKATAGGGAAPAAGALALGVQNTPSAPADGQVWVTAAGIFARVNGVTLQLVEYANTRVAKAWGTLLCGAAGAVTVTEGFNVTSASYAAAVLTVTFTNALANGNYCMIPNMFGGGVGNAAYWTNKLAASVGIASFLTTTGAVRNWANGDAVDFVIFDS